MLSFASAVFLPDHTILGTFSAVLETLPGATGHPDTLRWWDRHPEAWAANRHDPKPPAVVMPHYIDWLATFEGRPVFVGYPAAYDFLFMYWYLLRFAGKSPFSHSALDIKTMASDLLGLPYRDATKRRFPKAWFRGHRHTHVPLDDAIEQGHLFCELWGLRQARLDHRLADRASPCDTLLQGIQQAVKDLATVRTIQRPALTFLDIQQNLEALLSHRRVSRHPKRHPDVPSK